MASNFSSIGFKFETEEAYLAALRRMLDEAAEAIEAEPGLIAIWKSATGAQVYIQLEIVPSDGETEPTSSFVGLVPFFSGESAITVTVTEVFQRPHDNAFEGGIKGWLAPGGAAGEALQPIVFDPVDWPMLKAARLPFTARFQVCGFAQELKAYADENAFHTAQAREDAAGLAASAMIPIGLFATALEREGAAPAVSAPSSAALMTGRVIEQRVLTSELGQPFHWLLVESVGGAFDVVADPEIVEGEIAMGATIACTCLLIARVIDVVASPAATPV